MEALNHPIILHMFIVDISHLNFNGEETMLKIKFKIFIKIWNIYQIRMEAVVDDVEWGYLELKVLGAVELKQRINNINQRI